MLNKFSRTELVLGKEAMEKHLIASDVDSVNPTALSTLKLERC